MLFRQDVKRDGTRSIKVIGEWPDEDAVMRDVIKNEDVFFLEEGILRVVVDNGMATYRVKQEDADKLYLEKISSQLDLQA